MGQRAPAGAAKAPGAPPAKEVSEKITLPSPPRPATFLTGEDSYDTEKYGELILRAAETLLAPLRPHGGRDQGPNREEVAQECSVSDLPQLSNGVNIL